MPELPPPPPPPMSIAAALVDAVRRRRPSWSPSPPAVLGLAVVLALGVAALVVVAARPQPPPPEVVLPQVGSAGDPGAPSPADAGATVAVHAAGAFLRPGLYELPAGARVAQLVEAAGGAAPEAVLDAVNLAARLTDGERIYLPRAGETLDVVSTAQGPAVVDLNTATVDELDALPGIGPSTAQAILDHRRRHGRFRSVDELLEVRGIGEAKLTSLRPRVRV